MSDQAEKALAKSLSLEKDKNDEHHNDGELTDRSEDGCYAVFDEFQGAVCTAHDLHLHGLKFFGGSCRCRDFAQVLGQRANVAKSKIERTGWSFLDCGPLGMNIVPVFR